MKGQPVLMTRTSDINVLPQPFASHLASGKVAQGLLCNSDVEPSDDLNRWLSATHFPNSESADRGGGQFWVEGHTHTHLQPRRPELVSCLKPSPARHFLNPTTWFWCLRLTKRHRCFVPNPNQSNVELVHQDKTHCVQRRLKGRLSASARVLDRMTNRLYLTEICAIPRLYTSVI